ncbi:MAG: metallophosphoesterase [Alphaproteobacteria bacterium]|nr:metallophosphoesterase [Alphaproteobacteria bacterium]MCB9694459.1 metallophosphoesterase [Alphaproteobacteria bacterium]
MSTPPTEPLFPGWNRRRTVVEHLDTDAKVWFVSDMHLGDGTRSDVFFGKDRHLIALIERVQEEGGVLVVLGDAIDFNQAWSFTRVLRAHQELLSAMSGLSREGRLYYVIGNHDYDITLYREILNFRVCDELHIGDRVLALHGWQFDPFLAEEVPKGHQWSTTVHHLVERYLNTWLRIPLGEFYTLSNRLMFWLAHKIALVGNAFTRLQRALGIDATSDPLNRYLDYWAQGNMGDPMGIFRPAYATAKAGPWPWVICGHSHLPGIVPVPGRPGGYVNTGSWTFASSHYVVWDGERFQASDWITGRDFGQEFYEPLLEGFVYERDFFQWWRENYMGFLRFREGEERKGRLRGWESYVRDYQYLSHLRPAQLEPLMLEAPPEQEPVAAEETA